MVTRAVSTWSLHRHLQQYAAPDEAVSPDSSDDLISLLELPAELKRRGYDALQICHFHIPSRKPAYLAELRAALAASDIKLDALLVDAGDLTSEDADGQEAWIGEWLETGVALGARCARVSAGRSAPSEDLIADSANRLARLAAAYPGIRVVTENWHEMMPDADSVLAVLEKTGESVGLLVDLGNWSGPTKYAELARIAPFAEAVHAKCHFDGTTPNREDFQTSLQILKDAGYDGPLALIYDGPDDDEWLQLDAEQEIVRTVFG